MFRGGVSVGFSVVPEYEILVARTDWSVLGLGSYEQHAGGDGPYEKQQHPEWEYWERLSYGERQTAEDQSYSSCKT